MRVDVGKNAKRKGSTSPADARRKDPEPLRTTPAIGKKVRKPRPFGYSWEFNFGWWKKEGGVWARDYRWFETEVARDQSFHSFVRKHIDRRWYRDPRLEHTAETEGDGRE